MVVSMLVLIQRDRRHPIFHMSSRLDELKGLDRSLSYIYQPTSWEVLLIQELLILSFPTCAQLAPVQHPPSQGITRLCRS